MAALRQLPPAGFSHRLSTRCVRLKVYSSEEVDERLQAPSGGVFGFSCNAGFQPAEEPPGWRRYEQLAPAGFSHRLSTRCVRLKVYSSDVRSRGSG